MPIRFDQNPQGERLQEIYGYWTVLPRSSSPENKREEGRLGADLLTEFVQGASKCGSVLLFHQPFQVLELFVDPPGDYPINRFINPENLLISCRVARICDNIMHYDPGPSPQKIDLYLKIFQSTISYLFKNNIYKFVVNILNLKLLECVSLRLCFFFFVGYILAYS
jgi:hypothetical protein